MCAKGGAKCSITSERPRRRNADSYVARHNRPVGSALADVFARERNPQSAKADPTANSRSYSFFFSEGEQMSIAHAMLGEFEHEAKTTRKFLERIPQDKLTWKPHEKSHTAGALARHMAIVPGNVVRAGSMDQSPLPDFATLFKQPANLQEILEAHENSVETVRQILPTLDDARLMTN